MNKKNDKVHNKRNNSGLSKEEIEKINSINLEDNDELNDTDSLKNKKNKLLKPNNNKLINNKKNIIKRKKDISTSETTEEKKISKISKKDIIKFFFVSIVLLIIAFYVSQSIIKLVKNPTTTVFIKEGIIAKEETDIGYIIRDEEIVKGDNYKNGMEQIIGEGQKVAKNQSIFRYYSNNEDDLKKQIKDLDAEIEKAIEENNNDLFSSDTKMLDTQISEYLYKINDINDVQKIQESKKAIDEILTKKAKIAGELSPKGSHLKDLINERNEYQSQLTNDSEYIVSPKSGILSYRVDGLEETLTAEDFSKYNQEFLNGLNLKTGQTNATNTEQGKVVNSFECYIVCTSKSEEAKNAEVGDKVKIVLPNTRKVDATIDYILKEKNNEMTLTLKFDSGIGELLNYRKISFDIIWWESKGYKIPNSAIFTQNNLNYVIKSKMGILERVLVKIGKQTENFTIVENYDSTEIRELNVDKTVKTKVSVNDEILLQPTKDQIDSTQ
ncbi:MAG: hypothetical protein IKG14_03280 [Clostridia bacterium]|nr:hypothetical protein [Clostridia bacterium]